jgi:hypothetical protein
VQLQSYRCSVSYLRAHSWLSETKQIGHGKNRFHWESPTNKVKLRAVSVEGKMFPCPRRSTSANM